MRMRKILFLAPVLAFILSSCGTSSPENTYLASISSKTGNFSSSSVFVVGHKLTTSSGEWKNSPTSFSYQWQDCNLSGEACTNITGATSTTYILTINDVGHTIRVSVKATNSGGSSTQISAATPVIKNVVVEENKGCTVTLSSSSRINEELKPGAVVCLASASYGSITLSAKPASNATLTAVAGAHASVGSLNIESSNVTVSDLFVEGGGIVVEERSKLGSVRNDVIEHNDVGPTSGYGIAIFSNPSTPSENIRLLWNEVHDTSSTGEGDALRFDGWKNVQVIGNDIYNIKECSTNTCHTDTLQSYQAETPTEGLLLEKNYIHDTKSAQGFPFLKDGDVANVTIKDNLALRMSSNNPVTGIWVDDNTKNLIVKNNTYQATSGSQIQSGGSFAEPTAEINHNVFDALNLAGKYKYTEDYDIFTANNEWSFKIGSHSVLNSNPGFKNTATSDYRLVNNPNSIGVDWAPSEEHYGPIN